VGDDVPPVATGGYSHLPPSGAVGIPFPRMVTKKETVTACSGSQSFAERLCRRLPTLHTEKGCHFVRDSSCLTATRRSANAAYLNSNYKFFTHSNRHSPLPYGRGFCYCGFCYCGFCYCGFCWCGFCFLLNLIRLPR
jgi:hypothetical protein